jgi:cytochrome c551/c552
MNLERYVYFTAVGVGAFTFFASAGPVTIQLPGEVAVFRQDIGSEIANAQCLVCHSVEYVTSQPPLPQAFWKSSIQKMQQKYGATIQDAQVEPLTEYLTRNYGAATNSASAAPVGIQPQATQPLPAVGSGLTAPELAAKYGCSACHNATVKIVGPPLREIAAKYKSDPDATKKIEEQIQKGGSGKWGPIIMPPFPQAPAAETKVLAEWVLDSGATK